MKARIGIVPLLLAGLLALAGCQSRSGTGLGTSATAGPSLAFPIEHLSSAVTVGEGEAVRAQVLNATDGEQTTIVEIYASKSEDVVSTRGTPTNLVKTETLRLNAHSVGTTEYTTKTAGVCWVRIRAAEEKIIPQVAFGKEKEPRLVFKPGDLVRVHAAESSYPAMRGSTGYGTTAAFRGTSSAGFSSGSTGVMVRPTTGAAPTTSRSTGRATTGSARPNVPPPPPPPPPPPSNDSSVGLSLPSSSRTAGISEKANLSRELEQAQSELNDLRKKYLQEHEGRMEVERARKITNEEWGKAEKARAEAVAKLRETEKELQRVRAELERHSPEAGANSFSLSSSAAEVEVNQGETTELTLQIQRGKSFGQLVKVGADLPRGLSVEPRKFSFPNDKDASTSKTIKIAVGKDAVAGEHFITFTGYPEDGSIASVQVTIRVKKP